MYENLLNPNEFSSISGVSKQTLLFYEKKNVFDVKLIERETTKNNRKCSHESREK